MNGWTTCLKRTRINFYLTSFSFTFHLLTAGEGCSFTSLHPEEPGGKIWPPFSWRISKVQIQRNLRLSLLFFFRCRVETCFTCSVLIKMSDGMISKAKGGSQPFKTRFKSPSPHLSDLRGDESSSLMLAK